MLRLERVSWSTIKWLGQATNEYASHPNASLLIRLQGSVHQRARAGLRGSEHYHGDADPSVGAGWWRAAVLDGTGRDRHVLRDSLEQYGSPGRPCAGADDPSGKLVFLRVGVIGWFVLVSWLDGLIDLIGWFNLIGWFTWFDCVFDLGLFYFIRWLVDVGWLIWLVDLNDFSDWLMWFVDYFSVLYYWFSPMKALGDHASDLMIFRIAWYYWLILFDGLVRLVDSAGLFDSFCDWWSFFVIFMKEA